MPIIRRLEEGDAPAFHAVLDFVTREGRFLTALAAPPVERVRGAVAEGIRQGLPQLVAVDGGRIVGWCVATPGDAGSGMAHVGRLGMGLLPEHRGRGLGRRLLEEAIQGAKSYGFEKLELAVRASNHAAVGLGLRSGFREEGRKRGGWAREGDRDDLVLMALELKARAPREGSPLIRKLESGDVDVLHEIRLRMLREQPAAFVTTLAELSAKPPSSVLPSMGLTPESRGHFTLGAFDYSGRLIGVVGLSLASRAQERHRGKVVGTYVDPAHARSGIGSGLMKRLIDEAASNAELTQLHLRVTLGNEAALRLYLRCGFMPTGLEIAATKVGGEFLHALHMHRPLVR